MIQSNYIYKALYGVCLEHIKVIKDFVWKAILYKFYNLMPYTYVNINK